MFHQLKITSYAFIVALVPFLFLSSPAKAMDPIAGVPEAESCKGWVCAVPGQFCPEDAPGASDASYVCNLVTEGEYQGTMRWTEMTAGEVTDYNSRLKTHIYDVCLSYYPTGFKPCGLACKGGARANAARQCADPEFAAWYCAKGMSKTCGRWATQQKTPLAPEEVIRKMRE